MSTCLKIENFACLDRAEVRLSRLTVLIGPQASGKSIIAKLAYMFQAFLRDQIWKAEAGEPFDTVIQELTVTFIEWFPEASWGHRPFRVAFHHGNAYVAIGRTDPSTSELQIEFSDELEEEYNYLADSYRRSKGDQATIEAPGDHFVRSFLPLLREYRKRLADRLNMNAVGFSTFVPSGRSLFTSWLRTSIAFDPRSMVDPITRDFGRLIMSSRDEEPLNRVIDALPASAWEILGGQLVTGGNVQSLATPDGRQVPLHLMSSGQQELLPLLIALGQTTSVPLANTLFIEEPEAHLFPSAQNDLMELLMSVNASRPRGSELFLTTHSPYCLSKINNLMKAGELASRLPQYISKIDEIIPQSYWLSPSDVNAYGIVDREVISLITDDNLIDAAYLDSASSGLASEFSSMLEIEFGDVH